MSGNNVSATVFPSFSRTLLLCIFSRQDGDGNAEFKAMILSLIIHVLLLLFEIMLCINIKQQKLSWILVFSPVYIISPLSIIFCIWELRHERSVEVRIL